MARYTEDEIDQVADVLRQAKDRGGVAVLVGAGCSVSAGIPLAREFVGKIHANYPNHLRRLTDEKRSDYGACMGLLTPTERKALIEPYLENAKINWAHVALGCLIDAGYIQRVLTLNFDSILAKACGLLGRYPATYDFGIAPASDIRFLSEPCIIHLHGQGTGPVMMNSDAETERHAAALRPLLEDTLSSRSLLVVGYSGSADQIFPQLQECYHDQNRIYWLGYEEEPSQDLKHLLQKPYVTYLGGTKSDIVLVQLARTLECFPPCIMTDPAQHLLNEIESLCEFPTLAEFSSDILADLRTRLREKGRELRDVSGAEGALLAGNNDAVAENNQAPERLRVYAIYQKAWDLGQQGDSEAAIAVYDDVIKTFGSSADIYVRSAIAGALFNKGVRLGALNRSEEAIAVYDDVVSRFGEAVEPPLREQVAKALVNKGFRLGILNRPEEAIAVYDDVVSRFGEAVELSLRASVAKALINKGIGLATLSRHEEAIAVYDDVVSRFGEAVEPPLREQVAKALVNKGFRLGTLNRSEEAIAVCDDVVSRFGEAVEPPLREQVAKALVNKGVRLGALNRPETAIVVYDDVVSRFGEAVELSLREAVATAIVNKGVRLGALNRSEEAVAAYNDVVSRFGEAVEPPLQEAVAISLVNKGAGLGALNRSEEAIAIYDDVVSRFGGAVEPPLREQVAKAIVNKAAAILTIHNDAVNEELTVQLENMLAEAEALSTKPDYNSACVLARLRRDQACHHKLLRCKEAQTLPSIAHLLGDPDLRFIRRKKWFKDFIASLPNN